MFFVPAAFALDLTHVRLAGSIDVAGKRLDGVATLETAPREGPVRLDAEGLQITGVTVGGRRVPFTHRDGFLELDAPGGAPIVVTYTAGPSGGLRFEGEFASTQYATWTWLPCPSDPSDRATFDVDLRVPDGSVLVADGDGEAPAYTWGFAVGPYERHADGVSVVYTPRGVPVPEHAFRDTAAVLAKAAELTGMPYANPHYVTVLTPYSSAQEVVGGAWIGLPEVEGSPGTARTTAWYTSHEAMHQWFAVQVPLPSWSDHWVNEAYASWFEGWVEVELRGDREAHAAFIASRAEKRAAWEARTGGRALHVTGEHARGEGVGGAAVYLKGPVVLDALRIRVGDEAFLAGTKRFVATGGGTRGLRAAMEASCACDLAGFFRDEVGLP